MFCPCKLIIVNTFLLLAKTTGEILQTSLRSFLEFYTIKMSHWYQMNPNIFLYKTALSAQICYNVSLSL